MAFSMARKMARLVIGSTLAVGALTVGMVGSAYAGTSAPAPNGGAAQSGVVKVDRQIAARPAGTVHPDDCGVQVPNVPDVGYALCGTYILNVTYANGRREVFVIGTDHQIWHDFQFGDGNGAWSGWRSMGGYALQTDPSTNAPGGVYLFNNAPTIQVFGTDYNWWCNGVGPNGWSGWHHCY